MWFSGNYVELNITRHDAESMSQPGKNAEEDVLYAMKKPYIKKQLQKLNPEKVRKELEQYGAWDTKELSNHTTNLIRLLWVASGDIVERM
jgi:hypothetical protein